MRQVVPNAVVMYKAKGPNAARRASGKTRNTIEVAVRVRPDLTAGAAAGHAVPRAVEAFSYPSAVILGSDQAQCFEAVGAPLLARMDAGYNTTLLAYGQTGSGKTFTVFGPTGSLSEAALSFLGLGIQPPQPSLGRMIFDSQGFVTMAWWMAVFPGAAIFVIVLAFNLFGDGLRDVLDPKQRTTVEARRRER